MNSVVSFVEFRERGRALPTLVLIDLHHDPAGFGRSPATEILVDPIAHCRAALRHARACGMPVAFTRRVTSPTNMLASPNYPRWIEDFEPKRCDMVFDRQHASCYASPEFGDMADAIGGNYVVAGQFGEFSCLSTAIDASERDHRPTFLADALVSACHQDLSPAATREAAAAMLSLYVDITRTQSWILATSRRAGVRV